MEFVCLYRKIRDFVTPAYEAFAMLVLENHAPGLIHADDQKRKKACYDKNQSSAKYTKNKTRGNQDKEGHMRG